VHGIIEFSNCCVENCLYCGIRRDNIELKRYRLSEEEIVKLAEEAVKKYGFRALVLQSGEDPYYDVDKLCWVIKHIMENSAVLLFISVGEVGEEGLRKFYAAGARGALIRFETGNSALYSKLHPGDKLENRLQEIKYAKEIGFLVLTGGLIGLPEQTKEDILKDILLAKEIGPEMYTFGPFLPHPQTPLANENPPLFGMVLKTLAVLRIVDPEGKIVVTTAMETLKPHGGREEGFMAGANSVMLNLTPEKYRQLYQIYPNRIHERDSIDSQIKKVISDLQKLGRAPTDLGIREV
jgi:biotin synthase